MLLIITVVTTAFMVGYAVGYMARDLVEQAMDTELAAMVAHDG